MPITTRNSWHGTLSFSASEAPGRPGCGECRGLGWVRAGEHPVGHRMFGKLLPCRCRSEDLAAFERARLEKMSGLSPAQLALRMADLLERSHDSAAMRREAEQFALGRLAMVTFAGPPGVGKTTALHVCVNEARERRDAIGVYVVLDRLLEHVRQGVGDSVEGLAERLAEWTAAPMLAVDEVDKVKWTDWARSVWTRLLDERFRMAEERRAQTAFAMNKHPRDFLEAWDCDRLERFPVVVLADASMRAAQRRIDHIAEQEAGRKDLDL